jgi:hypothetical protein
MSFAYGSVVAAVLAAAGEPAAVEPAAVVVLAAVGSVVGLAAEPADEVEAENLAVVGEAAHHQAGAFVVVAGSLEKASWFKKQLF